jgi:hypothetical protein
MNLDKKGQFFTFLLVFLSIYCFVCAPTMEPTSAKELVQTKADPKKAAQAKNLKSANLKTKSIKTTRSTATVKNELTKSTQNSESEKLKPVMDPGQFFGAAAMGYAAAKECPEIVAKLFCYCGCDITDKHTSLLDCFTSLHGVDCHICQEEAMLALRLNNQGIPLIEIQKRVDQQYSSQYPFEQDTETYKKYKASRLWTKTSSNSENVEIKTSREGKTRPEIKAGSSCCSGGEKKN